MQGNERNYILYKGAFQSQLSNEIDNPSHATSNIHPFHQKGSQDPVVILQIIQGY